jgi:hypothetical protein
VQQGKLLAYADGAKRAYRVADVDAMSGATGAGEVQLTPAGADEDLVTLQEADQSRPPSKEDTVITAEGISVFDDEDLEVGTADPMAKTSIAPTVEDQISLEGVGSGSGLLDLTRESDDTSLGAEVLDHIGAEAAIPSPAGVMESVGETAYAESEPITMQAPVVVEEVDPSSGAFAGLTVAGTLIALVTAAVAVATMMGTVPGYVKALQENMLVFLGVSVVVGIALAVIGYVVGKSMAARAEALQRRV